jgi:(1->4)-alpha-D-glucan 1-alpha-D-glucosylmutase
MLYQALIGAWPLDGIDKTFVERMQAYAVKAAREAKQETSWLNPNPDYEQGLTTFLEQALDRNRSAAFLDAFEPFARRMALLGALNSLSQLALKLTLPGVPDLYQGTEFWDLSLVDPDNRRPVDFAAREAALAGIGKPDWHHLAQTWPDGRIKLALTQALLSLRRRFPALFTHGDYRPVEATGPHRNEVVAFARTHGRDAVIVAVGRAFGRATGGGRQWPTSDAWDATLQVGGLSTAWNVLGAKPQMAAAPQWPVSTLFGSVPIAVIEATTTTSSRMSARKRENALA